MGYLIQLLKVSFEVLSKCVRKIWGESAIEFVIFDLFSRTKVMTDQ